MRPLQAVAMGLVIVALGARLDGYDVLADPVGWLLVLHGAGRLPGALPHRDTVRLLAVLALLTSVPLWFPGVAAAIAEADDSLAWAVSLPQVAFVATTCLALGRAAAGAADRRAASWLRTGCTLTVAAGLFPILVLPGHRDPVVPLLLLAGLALVVVIVLLFRYSARGWALPDEASAQATGRSGGGPRTAEGAAPP